MKRVKPFNFLCKIRPLFVAKKKSIEWPPFSCTVVVGNLERTNLVIANCV